MAWTRSNEDGSTHVLEAMIVATIMLSAITFVVTYDQPPSSEGGARPQLARKADDALAIMAETPVSSDFGDDMLSAYIAECLNDRCSALQQKLVDLLPTGAAYALYVSNGHDTYPVLLMGEPTGEAVAASQDFEPRWSHTFVSTATDMVSVTDPLLTYELPIVNSNVVSPGGSHLYVKLQGRRADGSDYVLTGSYSTTARDEEDPTALAASLYFVDTDTDKPLPVHVLVGGRDVEQRLVLRLEETQGGVIPEGAELAVEIPRGWSARAPAELNPGWGITDDAWDRSGSYVGSTVRARLLAPLQADGGTPARQDLELRVQYHGDVLDYYPIHAHLSRGALASASVLVRGESHAEPPTLATPMLAMSVPAPMGAGEWTTWTLAAYVPAEDDVPLGEYSDTIEVRSIEIVEQEGHAIFGEVDATGLETHGGTWTLSTGHDALLWTASNDHPFVLSYDELLNLSFRVRASGTAGPLEARAAFVPPVSFDSWTGKLVQRSGWGFYRESFLPAMPPYDGFDASTGENGAELEHDIEVDAVYRSTPLPGSTTYRTSVIGAVEDSLYGSYVTAHSRHVAVGGEVVIEANVQSLLFKLAEAGQKAGVTMRFYPPWSGDTRNAIWEQENLDQGLLSGEVTQIVMLDVNGDRIPDPIVGTTNGRVIAYDALTGRRVQGNTFGAPVTTAAREAHLLPRINVMTVAHLYGEDHIVVGTDKNSDGVFVLRKDLSVRWMAKFNGADVVALDASVDFDGDPNGQVEIAAARTYEVGTQRNALVYIFKVHEDTQDLEPIPATPKLRQDMNAYSYSLGVPTAILAQERAGPWGDTPGVLIPIQTTADPGIIVNTNVLPPVVSRGALSTPRAGLQRAGDLGATTGLLFGAPTSVLVPYDHDRNGVDDIVMGGSSGYVFMARGEVLTQPLYSYILAPSTTIIDGDARSSAEAYILTEEGYPYMTDDGWLTNWGPDDPAAGALGISSNRFNSFWLVGKANQMWKTMEVDLPPIPPRAQMPPAIELLPVVPMLEEDPTYFASHTHDFTSVWFREEVGWVVGTVAASDPDHRPIILYTDDEGESWRRIEAPDGASHLRKVKFMPNGDGWIVGDKGTILYRPSGAGPEEWYLFEDVPAEVDLRDISCRPPDHHTCVVVGTHGGAFVLRGDGWNFFLEDISGQMGLPTEHEFYSVGFRGEDRLYIGSKDRVLVTFDAGPLTDRDTANFTTLPMNYVRNDARSIVVLEDGTGFVFGGSAANGRIWLLHDYHIMSQAYTKPLGDELDIPATATITRVEHVHSDVSLGLQRVDVEVSIDGGRTWESMGKLVSSDLPIDDARDARAETPLLDDEFEVGGRDLVFRFGLNTTPDKTILSPHLRSLGFEVEYVDGRTRTVIPVRIDFRSDEWFDRDRSSAVWDTALGVLRQPYVEEAWTRDVHGEVHDIQTGFDADDDGFEDLYVGTGDVLAENSPDHVIYNDPKRAVDDDHRVYMISGRTGDELRRSPELRGEVRVVRALVDEEGDPQRLFAVTWNEDDELAHLYSLDPRKLEVLWSIEVGPELPRDMEMGVLRNGHVSALVGTERPPAHANPETQGHLWAFDTEATPPGWAWTVIPDDLGKYIIYADVEPGWLYGPYVIEVEVVWKEQVTDEGVPQEVLRSARFYDHFMVTPPQSMSPATPVYTARLLVWMQDWG